MAWIAIGTNATVNAPKTTLIGFVRPPEIDVPPTKAAAIPGNKSALPRPLAEAEPACATILRPASPPVKPESAKAV